MASASRSGSGKPYKVVPKGQTTLQGFVTISPAPQIAKEIVKDLLEIVWKSVNPAEAIAVEISEQVLGNVFKYDLKDANDNKSVQCEKKMRYVFNPAWFLMYPWLQKDTTSSCDVY